MEPNSKLLIIKWGLKLEENNYEINYKKGKVNQKADELLRIQLNITKHISTRSQNIVN